MSEQEEGDLPPWQVVSSRRVIDDPWLRVRADDCVTAEGVRIAPFFITEHPDWAIVVAIDEDDRLLLVDQYRHGWGITSRELPTGAIDPDDANPVAAGQRELIEETGYGGGEWTLVATLAPNPANQSNRCYALLASGVSKLAEPKDEPTERLRLSAVPVPQALAIARSGGIVQAMHVAALAMALPARWSSER
ncbi:MULTISPECIES: NUDIX hydrolase [unclassified Sphingomonas]|uniref:NUDIX hydrolase n=1 Tax=unclassified Sphingomonas TaxID=196159 RepID=UPI001D13050F|nr:MULTISPECIES: NUDIX hydrolase [unclassified Sphingomonas]MCC2979440.1 NUDIX hydrolase [Sphingomonas sp. IC4-52]MCD2315332.1 NUDIX hydrolase [Sphingomonas sp. IC-11]